MNSDALIASDPINLPRIQRVAQKAAGQVFVLKPDSTAQQQMREKAACMVVFGGMS
ncbi:hypothetical protein GCM10027046_13430 [Uliginosibacterium flavum]|uniref:Uncharacterized protein n=1 Tax=Uliginosibacterium flavum TaxID=1396831 RepID=A0ABV2TSM3_9RHOO